MYVSQLLVNSVQNYRDALQRWNRELNEACGNDEENGSDVKHETIL